MRLISTNNQIQQHHNHQDLSNEKLITDDDSEELKDTKTFKDDADGEVTVSETTFVEPTHRVKSKKRKPFYCAHCPFVATRKEGLYRHIIKNHNGLTAEISKPADYQCPFCPTTITTRANLRRHIDSKHGRGEGDEMVQKKIEHAQSLDFSVVCEICGLIMLKHNIHSHMKKHSIEHRKPVKCFECDERFTNSNARKTHIRLCHPEVGLPQVQQTFKCTLCPKVVEQMASLKKHMFYQHTDEGRPFKCVLCELRFKTEQRYKLHMEVHERRQNRDCQVCKRKYTSQTGLRHHMKNAHNMKVSNALFRCPD